MLTLLVDCGQFIYKLFAWGPAALRSVVRVIWRSRCPAERGEVRGGCKSPKKGCLGPARHTLKYDLFWRQREWTARHAARLFSAASRLRCQLHLPRWVTISDLHAVWIGVTRFLHCRVLVQSSPRLFSSGSLGVARGRELPSDGKFHRIYFVL